MSAKEKRPSLNNRMEHFPNNDSKLPLNNDSFYMENDLRMGDLKRKSIGNALN